MFNTALYTGTGIVVAGLGAAYYAFANRNQHEEEQLRLHELQSRRQRYRTLDDSAISSQFQHHGFFRNDFQASPQEGGDPIDITQQFYSPNVTFEERNSHSPVSLSAPDSPRSRRYLKSTLHAISTGTGTRQGLNVARHRNLDLSKRNQSLFEVPQIVSRTEIRSPSTPATALSRDRGSLTRMLQAKRSQSLDRSPSVTKLDRYENDGISQESRPNLLALGNDSSKSVFDVETDSNFEFYVEDGEGDDTKLSSSHNLKNLPEELEPSERFSTPAGSNSNFMNHDFDQEFQHVPTRTTKMPEERTQLPIDQIVRRTDSPIVFFSNPRFGYRYACKEGKNLTASTILKNNNKVKKALESGHKSRIPKRIIGNHNMKNKNPSAKIATTIPVEKYVPSINLELKSCSTTEAFQHVLREKRRQLRPVRRRKSEGHARFAADSLADQAESQNETDSNNSSELANSFDNVAGHKDSTFFLFPPVLSESKLSTQDEGDYQEDPFLVTRSNDHLKLISDEREHEPIQEDSPDSLYWNFTGQFEGPDIDKNEYQSIPVPSPKMKSLKKPKVTNSSVAALTLTEPIAERGTDVLGEVVEMPEMQVHQNALTNFIISLLEKNYIPPTGLLTFAIVLLGIVIYFVIRLACYMIL